MKRPHFVSGALALATFFGLSVPFSWVNPSSSMPEAELIGRATQVFRRSVNTPSTAIPASVMQRSQAIAVFPGATEAGGRYAASGLVSLRGTNSRTWTAPAMVAFQGEIPVPLDADTVDFVLVALTARGVDYLSRAESRLSGANVVSPGPLGQETRIKMNTDMLAYIQLGDIFAGVTTHEFVFHEMKDANARVYGRAYATADVFRGGFRVPTVAQIWRDVVASYFREMS